MFGGFFKFLRKKNTSFYYTDKQLVLFRGDNDSFKRGKGYPARIYLDFDGYRDIINHYFKR